MPRFKAQKLSTLFGSVVKSTVATTTSATSSSAAAAAAAVVKPSPSSSATKASLRKVKRENSGVSRLIYESLYEAGPSHSDDSTKHVSHEISSILCGLTDLESDDDLSSSEVADDADVVEDDSDLSWFSNLFNNSTSLRRKELSRERKSKWIFKNTQKHRFDKLVSMCLTKLGTGSTLQVLCKLGRESGLKEYGAFIRGCIATARGSKDERTQVEQILEAYRLFQLMQEQGFPIEEDTFGPLLLYLIDMHMTDQFFLFLEIVKDEDPSIHPRLGYYEMLLFIEINNEEKIQELCDDIATGESEMGSLLHENYLLALCERDRKKELLPLLETIDITRLSSVDNIACIFKSLGRLSLETYAELFIELLKDCDQGAECMSNLIYDYATSMKNLAVENIIMKFKELHRKLDVELLPQSYVKLIKFCCDSLKVHLALDIVDEICEGGLSLSTETLNYICRACEDNSEFILVRRIHSMLHHRNLRPNSETFRSMINLNIRMKDFDNAYVILKDLERFDLMPIASMYNAIIAGYYREKNMSGVLRVLGQMKQADVKPDSQTFSYLISNSASQEEIMKYFEELKCSGVQVTKQIFVALVNAYAACGQFEKAKQVILDKGVPVKSLNEIKSALVSTLASHGQISDALDMYMEIKQSGRCLEPKAIISLIEHLQFEGELSIFLKLLEELNDPYYWVDGCCRVIQYCIRNRDLRSTVDLLKRLAEHYHDDDMAREGFFDEVFSHIADMDPPDLQFGMNFLKAIKKDLKLHPSRKCLDFLLSACVNAKDLHSSRLVWKEYETAGLPYNILSYLRMYQALLASGSFKAASKFFNQLPRDDPHVRLVIQACGVTYGKPKGKKKNRI